MIALNKPLDEAAEEIEEGRPPEIMFHPFYFTTEGQANDLLRNLDHRTRVAFRMLTSQLPLNKVYVVGRIADGNWTDEDGIELYIETDGLNFRRSQELRSKLTVALNQIDLNRYISGKQLNVERIGMRIVPQIEALSAKRAQCLRLIPAHERISVSIGCAEPYGRAYCIDTGRWEFFSDGLPGHIQEAIA